MFVSCLCRVRQRDFTQLHALCVSMCMPTCTRYVCGSAGTSLSRQRALPRSVCMRQRGHFTFPLSRQRGTFSLSRTTCMRQRGHFHSSTVPLSRQRGGTWACLYVGGDGLPDCSAFEFVWFAFESVVRVLWSCGPAGVVCAVMLSAMYAHDLARLRTTC